MTSSIMAEVAERDGRLGDGGGGGDGWTVKGVGR